MDTNLKNSQGIRQLRDAFGQYPTGVAIVSTYRSNSKPVGMTINSLTSVSLAPALLSWCIDKSSPSYEIFTTSKHFAITVLSESQVDMAIKFATRGADKFSGLKHGGKFAPVIPGGVAWYECETCHSLPLGDHSMLVGKILDFSKSTAPPLIFRAGRFLQLEQAFRQVA